MTKESLKKYPITFTNYMCDICKDEYNYKDKIHHRNHRNKSIY